MSRSRWIKQALAGVLALSAAAGCKQQLFMEPADYVEAIKVAPPKSLETNPHGPIVPPSVDKMGELTTVTDFVRPPRYMTLRECVAIALEQGNTGLQTPTNFGFKNEQLDQFSGRLVAGTDAVRAFAIDPAVASAEVERSLSRFDARWITTMQWQKIDQPVAAQFLSFQNSRDAATVSTTLAKGLPTGGVVGITASTDYSKFSTAATQQTALVNPNYIPRIQVSLEQPLLQLFGVEINQIAGTGPFVNGSQVLPGIRPAGGVGTEGILITRLRVDQTRANFDLQMNYLLANVEAAYWNLYSAYYNLYAQEEGLRQAFEGYRFIRIRVELGTAPPQDLDQIEAQFHRFQGQVYQARGQVLESERQLRGLVGFRSDDGVRIVPIDDPNLAPYVPDFHEAANDAVAMRPEVMLARQELKFRQLDLMLQKNLRRPDLRSYATYDMAGLGTRLGGSTFDAINGSNFPGNAFGSLAQNRFNSWTLGLRLDMPIGFRDANALVRQAQLNLARSYVQLRDTELKSIEYLALQYRRVVQTHAQIAPARAERESLQRYVYRIREVIRIGSWTQQYFLNYLTVQQQLASAIANESQAIAQYQIALASFEFAKGTIQQYNNVSVGEGPLPPWVQKRAKDHIRERTEAALKLREVPVPPGGPALGDHAVAPAGGTNSSLTLPAFAAPRAPLPDSLPPKPDLKGKKPSSDAPPAPAPRPLGDVFAPNAGVSGAAAPPAGSQPLPTFAGTSPTAATNPDPAPAPFTPGGRVTLPTRPTGSQPYLGTPAPPLPGGTGGTTEFFQPNGAATLPPPPKGTTPGAVVTSPPPPTGTAGAPTDYFQPNGRVTLPPPPKRSAEPVWSPPSSPAPLPIPAPVPAPAPAPPPSVPPGVGTLAPPPAIPPTLPGVPGGQ
jgi:outer membrane protein TolC